MPPRRRSHIAITMALAIGSSALAAHLARDLSDAYYAVAPYHYDSAAYRFQAVEMHRLRESAGPGAALAGSLRTKDSLDLTLRLLFRPGALLTRHGHLAVLSPFLGLFLALVIWYLVQRTGSLALGLAVAAFLFTFPSTYNPYTGLADYWKDNLATWLLGSAVLAWLLSDRLRRRGWAFLSGLLLGLLAMQRAVAALYGGILFLPLLLFAVYRLFRSEGLRQAARAGAAFLAPVALLAGGIAWMQWEQLYHYYFVAGYAYGSPVQVARFLASSLPAHVGLGVPLLGGIAILHRIARGPLVGVGGEVVAAGAMVVSLPVCVILTRAFYHGVFALWTGLVIVLLAVVVAAIHRQALGAAGRTRSADSRPDPVLSVVLAVALIASLAQYALSSRRAGRRAVQEAPHRRLYAELAGLIVFSPQPRAYTLVFDEVEDLFWNQVFFDLGVSLPRSPSFISIHDSYYQARFGDLAAEDIAAANMRGLEGHPRAVLVTRCAPSQFRQGGVFQGRVFQPRALEVALAMTRLAGDSARWRPISRLASPYGCLAAYESSGQ